MGFSQINQHSNSLNLETLESHLLDMLYLAEPRLTWKRLPFDLGMFAFSVFLSELCQCDLVVNLPDR